MEQKVDFWSGARTRHDLPADEVISALQKEIRRGRTENAALLAYEMLVTSPEMEAKLWQRLLVISVEDIGMGSPQAAVLINQLYQMHQTPGVVDGDRRLFAIHAVRFLCTCPKDRSSDEMLSWLRIMVEEESLRPEIPDYALDMHTAHGRQLKRGNRHFLDVGALVSPEMPGRERKYREELLKLLKDV